MERLELSNTTVHGKLLPNRSIYWVLVVAHFASSQPIRLMLADHQRIHINVIYLLAPAFGYRLSKFLRIYHLLYISVCQVSSTETPFPLLHYLKEYNFITFTLKR